MCTICDLRIEFSIDHPLSLSIAVATRRAIEAGLLPEPDGLDNAPTGTQLRQSAIETLKAAQQRLEWTHREDELMALPDFFVLMVESRTWGFFRPTPKGFDPNCRPSPPNVSADGIAERDAVLVSSELVMRETVRGRLPFEQALEERIIALDADGSRFEKLLRAWSKAYPKVGFSRFVCA